ncbi:hypothetical protein BDZ91DRAFT_759332 [Kalaharituber pfeilii]|nr:hypothetical protein BDZ91DRAFT_759332 [Kalaharituber pfeilii]
MTNWRERGYVPDSDGDESDFGQGQREGEEPGTAAAHTKSLELTFNGGPILRSEDNTNDPPLLFTQNRTFVADSDDEENQSLGADFEQEVPGVVNTVAQESQVGKDKAPALQLLDLSNEPDTDEDVAVQIAELSTKSVLPPTKHEIVSSSILEKGRLPGSPIGEASEPRTSPKNTQLAPSQESSPLSDPPSHLTTPTLSPISQRPRTSKFSVSIPPVSTEAYPATSISPTANDDFTSGPLRNLRQRKPIQLNPYLIEQARYRQTLKARGIKPIIIQPEEPEITAPADPEEDEYQTSGEEEDESQLQSRRQSAFVDSHSEEIRIQNAREQSDQALMDDDYDLPDVHELFRQVIREDTAAQGNGVKRRKLTHTYSRKATRSKPQKPIWKQPPILKHPTPATKPTDNRKARLLTPPPRNIDIFTILSDDSSPVRPSQRRPLSQRSVNTFSSGVVGSNNSDDEDTPPRSSIRSRARAVSIASDSSASSSESSNSSIDLRRLQKKTNGVLPASWWKLDQKRQASKKEKAKQAKKTSSSRNIQQPGIARAKLSRKPRAANENVFSLVDGSSTHETESDSDIPRIIPSASIARPSEPQLRQQSRSGVGGWLAFDDDIIMEDDRIDAMLQYSRPRKKQTTLNVTRRKRSRDHDEAGQLRGSGTCNTQSYGYGRSKVLNKRHAREGSPHTRSAIKPPPRLSVVDVYKHQKATSGTSPPQFLKIALRTASKRGRKARSGPERKLFCLETETDTKDVQDVLRGWREGTLDVIPYTRGLQEIPNDGARDITRYEDRDMGDPGGKPVNSPILERFEEPHRLRIENPVSKSLRKSRQTLLTGIVQRTSIPSVSAHKSARPTLPKPPSGRQTILKHPRPAPGQVETLSGEFYKRPVTIRRAATPLIDILRMQRPARPIAFNHPALGRFLEDSDLVVNPLTFLRNQKHKLATSSDSSLVPKVSGIPPSPPPPIPRIALRRVRRKNTPQRIDADTRERRQPAPEHVPVDDGTATGIIPTPVNETRLLTGLAPYGIKYSVNFDTHPLKSGTIFNSETFIGEVA